MKLRFIILAVILLVVPLAGSAAQDQVFAWEVRVYDASQNAVLTIVPTGISQTVSVPAPPPPENYFFTAGSADGRYLVLAYGPTDYRVVDLQQGTCCVLLPNPIPTGQIEAFLDGAFSPDGTQMAVGYVGFDASDNFDGGIITIDLASGAIINQIRSNIPQFQGGVTAIIGEWTDAGIEFVPSCWGCEPPLTGEFLLWNPQNNGISNSGKYMNRLYGGDTLPNSGESLHAAYNDAYPLGEPPAMFFTPNVIEYYPAGTSPLTENFNPQIVYFSEGDPIVSRPRWVLNGEAFIVYRFNWPTVFLTYRDGGRQNVAVSPTQTFLAGTPDGWLMTDVVDGRTRVIHYQQIESSLQIGSRVIAELGESIDLLNSTPLNGSGFPPFDYSIAPPVAITCPGFMPSRLEINMFGQVTPGPANNFRDGPTLSSNVIGQLPGETIFLVLDGPVCADNMAWWQVDYNGQIGWTSEGTGAEYWLQPVQ